MQRLGGQRLKTLVSILDICGSIGVEELEQEPSGSIESLMSTELVQPGVNIISLTKFFEHRQKVEQLSVVHVVKP